MAFACPKVFLMLLAHVILDTTAVEVQQQQNLSPMGASALMEHTVQKEVLNLSSALLKNIVVVKLCQHLQVTAQLVITVWEAPKQTDQQMGPLVLNVQRVHTVLKAVPHQHHVLMVLTLILLRMKR